MWKYLGHAFLLAVLGLNAAPAPARGETPLQGFRTEPEAPRRFQIDTHLGMPLLPEYRAPDPVLVLLAQIPHPVQPYGVFELVGSRDVEFPFRNESGPGGRRVLLDLQRIRGHYEQRGEDLIFVAVCAETSPNSFSDLSVGPGAGFRFSWQATPHVELHGSFSGCVGLGVGDGNPKQAQEIASLAGTLGAIVRFSDQLYFRFDYRLEYRSTLKQNGSYSQDFHPDGGAELISTRLFVVGGEF